MTANERSLLEWLLRDPRIDDAATLRAQIAHARVVTDEREFPTWLHLAVSGAPRANVKDGPLPGDCIVVSASGETTSGLILWVSGGYLESVEHWWLTDEMPTEFPSVDRLRPLRSDEDYSTRTTDSD